MIDVILFSTTVTLLTMIISAIRVIVNLNAAHIATCGSLASTVSDSESDDDAFLDHQLVRPNR